jgi:hypothetical protein
MRTGRAGALVVGALLTVSLTAGCTSHHFGNASRVQPQQSSADSTDAGTTAVNASDAAAPSAGGVATASASPAAAGGTTSGSGGTHGTTSDPAAAAQLAAVASDLAGIDSGNGQAGSDLSAGASAQASSDNG